MNKSIKNNAVRSSLLALALAATTLPLWGQAPAAKAKAPAYTPRVSADASATGQCKKCWYKVLLVVGKKFYISDGLMIRRISDYHWYRQDADGTWSHKPGEMVVTSQVVDPVRDARKRGYKKVCGYFCFKEGAVDADR